MSHRNPAHTLILVSALLSGCAVERAPQTPAADGNGGVRTDAAARNAPETAASPQESPAPAASASPESAPESAEPGGKLEAYSGAAAADLAPEQRQALGLIRDDARRLLALRGYLRAGGDAMKRWAWSREQIEGYEKSPEYAAALAEVEKVKGEFASANAGYTLRVNTKVRSLDEQLKNWNEAESVARAGGELLARAREELAGAGYAGRPGASDVERFRGFLRGFTPRVTPTLAAPGLSPHGQLRAFDFQVMRGGQLVAGTSAASAAEAWDAAGWTLKLQEAVARASTKFAGPLAAPREPWHYDYRP